MDFDQFKQKIEEYKEKDLKIFTSSSFQSHSIPLLHMISRVDNTIPVYFLNTGYHFAETISFRDHIKDMLNLNVKEVKSPVSRNMQKDASGRLLFTSDPDFCCYLNKTLPMEPVLEEHDVWINGVRADQSVVRKGFKIEEKAPHGVIRFHPMLDWNSKMIYDYRKEFDLPSHPLEEKGYFSIGCEPCTRRFDPDMQEREARWYGMNKTECGLNTDLVVKDKN